MIGLVDVLHEISWMEWKDSIVLRMLERGLIVHMHANRDYREGQRGLNLVGFQRSADKVDHDIGVDTVVNEQ